MDTRDLWWLAGLLEGEATFGTNRLHPYALDIDLSMTDRDVIVRVAALFGSQVSEKPPQHNNRKIQWRTRLTSDRAAVLLQSIKSFMGDRRRARIGELLAGYVALRGQPRPLQTRGRCSSQELSLYWLAGLLEGEGTFPSASPGQPNKPGIVLEMADEDIIARVSELWQVSYFVLAPRPTRFVESALPVYRVQTRGRRAVQLMQEIHPLMGIRRQEQISRAIASYDWERAKNNNGWKNRD